MTESLNMDAAVQALTAILPDEGEKSTDEALSQETEAAVDEELSGDADASDDETPTEQSEEDEESEESEEPQTFTVKVDGKEVSVTLDELQQGYSRTQDYTRKTQQIAEVRKQVEQESQAIRAERAQYAQLLGALKQQVQQAAEPQIDWDRLYQEDPIEWVRQKELVRENQTKYAAIQSEQQRLAEISLAQEQDKLMEVLPEWKDPAKAKAEKALLIEFGQKAGFQPDELKNIFDHRVVNVLRKAALYEQMMSKRGNIKPVVNNGPRPAKPGAAGRVSTTSESTRAKQRLAKTGRVQDAVSAIELLLK